ncbi:MAG: hypothetical protein ACQEVA_07150 [Myxococcota bacterium]
MTDWSDLLRGLTPRADLHADFPAVKLDQDQPVWISREEILAAAVIAARVLEVVAMRGGTRLGASAFESLRKTVARGLDKSARNLCDDEARRVLRWLEEAEPVDDAQLEDGPPEVDVMYASDLESRASVANFAIDEGYDLEMEYFDADREIWPRIRCTPLAVHRLDDEEISLRFEARHGEREVALRRVRWLMPVTRREVPRGVQRKEPGEVIRFPAGKTSDD